MSFKNQLRSMEDVEAGTHLLVLRGPMVRRQAGLYIDGYHEERFERDTSSEGLLFEVVAVDLPFLAVRLVAQPGHGIRMIDMRSGVRLKIASEKLVEVVKKETEKKPFPGDTNLIMDHLINCRCEVCEEES